MDKADVVIIGAGIGGLSSGYWLAKAGAKVIVLDKGRANWEASSRATGYLSLRADQPKEIPLAAEAERLWGILDEELGYPTEWTQRGRMWAAWSDKEARDLGPLFESFQQSNIPFRLIDGDEARRLIPCLSPGVTGAVYTARSGHANPQRTSQAFAWAFADLGGEIREFTPVTGISRSGGRVVGVETPKGAISADRVICCAGPQSELVGRMVGIEIPVAAARLEAMVTAPLPPLFDIALVGNGISARQTRRGNIHFNGGPHEWVGVTLDKESPKPTTPLLSNMARRLAELIPSVRQAKIIRSWAGIVDVTPDQLCIIDRPSALDGFVVAVTSGHGFGLAPAVGKVVSELTLTGRTSVPIGPIGLGRFSRLDPKWKERLGWEPGRYNT